MKTDFKIAAAGLLLAALAFGQPLPLPEKLVVLTFDDAVASHATHVAPLLKKFGFEATFFVCEFPPDFADKSKYMSWEQIQSLHRMGFEIGNHTHTHKHVNRITREQFDAELKYIEDKLVSLGAPKPVSFAYPGYSTHPMALEALAERGYRLARAGFDRPYRPETDNPLLIPGFTTKADNREQILNVLQQARRGEIIVLTIHGVPDTAHPWVNTPPELFEEYLRYLRDNRFTVIAMRSLLKYLPAEKR